MDNNNIVLEVRNVTRAYGSRIAVDNVSLTVERGEVFGFLGPNGAGKTTLIKSLTGMSRPDRGEIIIFGHNIATDFPRAIANVGAIIENPDMYNYLSGYDNLKYFSAYYDHIGEREIWDAIELVGMTSRAKEKMARYSLGMKQRLGIAQAIMHKPKLLILDEPTNGLDPSGIKEVRELLKRLASEQGMSVFISSHILPEMQNLCDRVGIINKGKLIAVKSLHEDDFTDNAILKITTDDGERASALVLQAFGVSPAVEGNKLRFSIPKSKIAEVNAALVGGGIAVTSFATEELSLENLFIELTQSSGGEGIV